MSVVNALSSTFSITSYRETGAHTIEFENGIKTNDKTKRSSKKHGTKTSFIVSPKYMGKECTLPEEECINWVDSLFYLDFSRLKRKGITCKWDTYDGLELVNSVKFKPKEFKKLLKNITPEGDVSNLCFFEGDGSIEEPTKQLVEKDGKSVVVEKIAKKNIHLEIAFRYSLNPDFNDNATYSTYCNYTNTTEHGTHLQAFEDSFCRYIQSACNDSMSEAQKKKFKVTWDDIRTNLFCCINLTTNAAVEFQGNAKKQINCPNLMSELKGIISSGLEKDFKENPSHLKEIISTVLVNTKARVEANKLKTATTVERVNNLKEHLIPNYIRCNNTGKQWKEIFLVEGDSARGSARNASDPDTQALFMLRGVPLNPIKASLAEVMANKEYRELVTVLRTGIGDKFDMSKLYFNRINIMTDADIDGLNISAQLLAFFYRFMRPIIEEGKLYKVYTPLYVVDDKNHPYIADKTEMTEVFHKKITKAYKLKPKGKKSWFSKDEISEFLIDTYEYRDNLINAAKQSGNIHKFFVEDLIATMVLCGFVRDALDFDDPDKVFSKQANVTKVMSILQKKYPEMTVDEHGRFSGLVEGKMVIVKIGQRFYSKTSDLIPIYKKYGINMICLEKGTVEKSLTIGEFLDLVQKLNLKIRTRIKGLGELNADQLHDTTMDINHRFSMRYTIADVEKELAIFNLTHGDSKASADGRKELMRKFKIKRDELDN